MSVLIRAYVSHPSTSKNSKREKRSKYQKKNPHLQREKYRKPTHHPLTLPLHRQRIGAQLHARIEDRFEISSEAVTDGSISQVEMETRVALVVFVSRIGGERGHGAVGEGPGLLDVGDGLGDGNGCGCGWGMRGRFGSCCCC